MKPSVDEISAILGRAKELAKEYRRLTCKPLGITGEVAEFAAASILGLELADARQPGYDAIRNDNGVQTKIQIKGRCLQDNPKPGQRIGSIQLDREWDIVLLVLMDEYLDVSSIYEATRPAIQEALQSSCSKALKRGALPVSKFKKIGKLVWTRGTTND